MNDIPSVRDGIDYESLRPVGLGLTIIYASLVVLIVSVLFGFGLRFFFIENRLATPNRSLYLLISYLPLFAIGLSWLMSLAGTGFCVRVPAAARARGFALASLILGGLQLLLMLPGFLFGGIVVSVAVIFYLGSPFSTLCFLIFLRRLAEYVAKPRLAARARNIIVFGSVMLLVLLCLGVVLNGEPIVLALVGGTSAIALFVMYANLIGGLAKVIQNSGEVDATADDKHLM